MSSQAFFWVNIGLGVILLGYFLIYRPRRAQYLKTQGAIFVYNGHNFNAYEVLGLPSNASREMLLEKYREIQACQSSDKIFLEKAIRALLS